MKSQLPRWSPAVGLAAASKDWLRRMKWLPIVVSCALGACAARSAPPPLQSTGHAWMLFIDDMHLDFRNTGRLRDLLKLVASELLKEGDAFMIRSSGPSLIAVDWTVDRSALQSELRKTTGNALRLSDFVDTGRPDPLFEVRYRAGIAMAFASELVSSARAVRARRVDLVYISNGYDLDDPRFRVRLLRLADFARAMKVRIFPINPRMLSFGASPELGAVVEGWERHVAATQQSLRLLADETGGLAPAAVQDSATAVRNIAAFRR